MSRQQKHPVRIYADHWEDYESIGDQAMLLNALRRLEYYLGNCEFVLPLSPEKRAQFSYPNMVVVVPPHLELVKQAKRLSGPYSRIRSIFPTRFAPPIIKFSIFLEIAVSIISIKSFLYSFGVHFVFGKSFRNFLDEIKKCDVFFTVGDCSLNDYWLDGVILKSWLIKLVRPYVSISVLSSQGLGPLETPWARNRLVGALKTLDILSFRDFSYSTALVKSESLADVPYKIVADEAFSYPVAGQTDVRKVLNEAGISQTDSFIVVKFRTTDFTQSTTFLLNKIAELLDQVVIATDKRIVFISMSTGNNYGRDHEAGVSLKNLMKQGDKLHVLDTIDKIELVKGVIGAAAYSIGISYHLHVFSLSQGHPTLILYTGDYYKIKSEGLIAYYGLPNRSANFNEISVELALNYVLEIEKNYAAVCAHNSQVNKALLENNDWTITTLKNLLTEKNLIKTRQD